MRYIKSDYVEIKEVKLGSNTFYQIGIDDWNILVGLGGLLEILSKTKEIINHRIMEDE